MADPVMTTLCSTCHIHSPQYKCPRCGAQSCSLQCVRKHKAWASCTGIRDVTAFVPAKKLRTPAGIDHDYNFLRSIENARSRNDREIIDARGLLTENSVTSIHWRERWRGDQLSFVKAERRPGATQPQHHHSNHHHTHDNNDDERLNVSQRKLRKMYTGMGIDVVHMPKGLARQKENATAWNKRTGRINWQVEWLFYEDGTLQKPIKILRKALDNVPLYRAFASTMEWVIHGRTMRDEEEEEDDEHGPPKKKRRRQGPAVAHDQPVQHLEAMTWSQSPYPCQSPFSSAWDIDASYTIESWAREAETEQWREAQYFLLKPRTKPKQLIPLNSAESLQNALPGRTVIEFPTVYVLPRGAELPSDHELGSTERSITESTVVKDDPAPRLQNKRNGNHVENRPPRAKGTALQNVVDQILSTDHHTAKKRKAGLVGIQDLDDGEVNSEGEELAEAARRAAAIAADTTSSESSTSEEEDSGSEESGPEEGAIKRKPSNGNKALVVYDSWSEDE